MVALHKTPKEVLMKIKKLKSFSFFVKPFQILKEKHNDW